jgi:chromosome segregation ATPase
MSESLKPRRAHAKSVSSRSRPPQRDPRSEGTLPPRKTPRPRLDALPGRISVLEAELQRLNEARGAEADELARMLVRIAAAERARAVAEERAEALASRLRELEALREEVRRGTEAIDLATRRAELAERSAADGAEALERTRAELESDRLRSMDLDAKLARMRREHGDELAALRIARSEAEQQAARAREEERTVVAQARQRAATAEECLAETRRRLGLATGLIEQVERREEMSAALRARAFERARRVLAGDIGELESEELVETLKEDEIEEVESDLSE